MKPAMWIRYTSFFSLTAVLLLGCGNQSATTQSSAPSASAAAAAPIATVSVAELHQRLQAPGEKPLVVDVREQNEYDAGHIEGVRLAPLGNVEASLADVPKGQEILLVCRSGNRSGKAAKRLAERGYTNLANVEGGMVAWEKNGYPTVK